jgi:hypothetical protein
MSSNKPVLKTPPADRDITSSPFGTLSTGLISSPKSPKFNELLARHKAIQIPGSDLSLPVKIEGNPIDD